MTGGGLITNNDDLAALCRVFRNYGSEKRYHNKIVGANSRLDELQAALLSVKLKHIDSFNDERNLIANNYLSNISNNVVQLPLVRPGATSSWHQFVVRTSYRDELKEHLLKNDIESLIHYPIPPHLSDAYQYLGHAKGAFPIAEQWADEVLSLPIYNGMTSEEQEYVIGVINNFRN